MHLHKVGKEYTCAVHRLVGAAFVLNEAGPGAHCHHRDANKQNNAFWNLQWLSRAEHQQTIQSNMGERHWKAKLTEEAVIDIRSSELSNTSLAEKYHVDIRTIKAVRDGVSWRHVAVPSKHAIMAQPVAVDDTMDATPAVA